MSTHGTVRGYSYGTYVFDLRGEKSIFTENETGAVKVRGTCVKTSACVF